MAVFYLRSPSFKVQSGSVTTLGLDTTTGTPDSSGSPGAVRGLPDESGVPIRMAAHLGGGVKGRCATLFRDTASFWAIVQGESGTVALRGTGEIPRSGGRQRGRGSRFRFRMADLDWVRNVGVGWLDHCDAEPAPGQHGLDDRRSHLRQEQRGRPRLGLPVGNRGEAS